MVGRSRVDYTYVNTGVILILFISMADSWFQLSQIFRDFESKSKKLQNTPKKARGAYYNVFIKSYSTHSNRVSTVSNIKIVDDRLETICYTLYICDCSRYAKQKVEVIN